MNAKESIWKERWDSEFAAAQRNRKSIMQVMNILAAKRVTLEEKMITAHLKDLAETYDDIGKRSDLLQKTFEQDPFENILENFHTLNVEISSTIESFLKMANFNLNFLEQYYEHDFYDKLLNEFRFLDRARKIRTQLTNVLTEHA
jgi:hypothetical protein